MQTNNTDIRGERQPRLVKIMLNPNEQVFEKCSPYTKTNFVNMSVVLLFTASISGIVLGSALTQFCFNGKPWTYPLTITLGILLYLIIDRLVIMANAKKNAAFIKASRYFIAIVFGVFNSLLIDTTFFKSDIEAERNKEIALKEVQVQRESNKEIAAIQLHKEMIFSKIKAAQTPLRERSNELIREVEGAGFSGNVGKGAVYQVKKDAFDRDSIEIAHQISLLLLEARNDDSALARLDRAAIEKKKHVPAQISNGALHTLDLLHTVVLQKSFNTFIALLFFVMCMILELLPLLSKYYIDLSEYFQHIPPHVNAYLELRESDKQRTVQEQTHHRSLKQKHRLTELSLVFASARLTQKNNHSENILNLTGQHFAAVVPLEDNLAVSYPNQFDQHIESVFENAYNAFEENQQEAFQLEFVISNNEN